MMTAAPSYGATIFFNVNQTDDLPDTNPGDGICSTGTGCSVRAAITEANAVGPGDTAIVSIPGSAGLFDLTLGELVINSTADSVVIGGAGAVNTRISGNNASRVFNVTGSHPVTFVDLRMQDGFVNGDGGCLLNDGPNTTLDTVSIQDCATGDDAGGSTNGGGVANLGGLTVTVSSIRFNTATGGGGGIWAQSGSTVDIDNTFIGGNVASLGAGGGVLLEGSNQPNPLSDNTYSDNEATVGGGLAAFNTSVVLFGETYDSNVAYIDGGGIYGNGAQVNVTGGSWIGFNWADAHPSDVNVQLGTGGGIHVRGAGGFLSLVSGTEVPGNTARSGGGGIYVNEDAGYSISAIVDGNETLSGLGGGMFLRSGGLVTGSTVTSNEGLHGGGIAIDGSGTTNIVGTKVSVNTVIGDGGGILAAGLGNVNIVQTAILDNTAGDDGGGLSFAGGQLSTVSTTIALNDALDAGGLFVSDGAADLYYTTVISNNTTDPSGQGGGVRVIGATTEIGFHASVIGQNFAEIGPNCDSTVPVDLHGFNVYDLRDCSVQEVATYSGSLSSNVPTATPDLTATGDYYTPEPFSQAIDIVNLTACDEIEAVLQNLPGDFGTVDQGQNAVNRPQGAGCDAGAVEVPAAAPATLDITASVDTTTVSPGASVVNLGSIPVKSSSIEASDDDPTQAVPLASVPLASVPLASVDLAGTPLASVPLASVPLASVPLASVPLASVPLASVPLASVPLASVHLPEGWDSLLALHPRLAGRPLHTVSWLDIVEELQAPDTPNIAPGFIEAFENIQLGDMDLAATPLASVPLAAVMMAPLEMLDVPLPFYPDGTPVNATDPDDVFNAWCAWFADAGGPTCADLGLNGPADADGVNMLTLGLAAAPLASVPLAAVPLASVPLAAVPLASVPLASVDMSVSPLASVPLAAVYLEDPVAAPLASVPLAAVDLETSPLAAVPLASVPLASVPLASVPLAAVPLASVPLAAVAVQGAPLASVPLASVPLASVPLASVPLASVPLAAVADALGQATFDALFTNCPSTGCDPNATFQFAVEQGWISGSTPMSDLLPLWADATYGDIEAALDQAIQGQVEAYHADPDTTLEDVLAWGSFTLGWLWQFADEGSDLLLAFANTLLGQLAAGGAAAYGDAGVGDLPPGANGATLGDLLTSINWEYAGTPALTYIDLFFGLLPKEKFPWADLDLTQFDVASADPNGQSLELLVEVDLANVPLFTEATITATLPPTFQPGKADPFVTTLSEQIPDVTLVAVDGSEVTWEVTNLSAGIFDVHLPLAAGLHLGGGVIDVVAEVTSGPAVLPPSASATTDPVQVIEEFEPNDTPVDIVGHTPFDEDTIVLSHVGREGDVDLFKLDVDAGDRISVVLGNFDEDLDLVLYAPLTGPPLSSGQPAFVSTSNSGEKADDESFGDVPRLADRPLYELSAARGLAPERIDTAAVQSSGEYLIQVSGFDSAVSGQPYTLRARVLDAPPPVECAPWPFVDSTAGPAAATPVSGSPTTLMLVNEQRTRQFEGSAGWGTIDAALDNFMANTGQGALSHVVPAIVEVSALPSVQDAYAGWDADRCSVDAANAVVEAIRSEVTSLRDQFPSITSVVVVGPDRVIPSGRLVDDVPKEAPGIANERGHWPTFGDTMDELVAALQAGRYFSDDPYVDSLAELGGALPIFVPEIGIGRLVETPSEIAGALNRFVQFDGLLDVSSTYNAAVTGYDFLTDGANAVGDALDANNGGNTDRSLIRPDWTDDDLAALFATNPQVLSLNAHFDHHRLLPADQDKAGTEVEDRLFTQDEFDALAPDTIGSVLFSMGCHAGLSVTDVSLSVTESRDWAQVFSGAGAVFAGSSGFGYGDTDIVAYTELLMARFAEGLDGSTDVGTAMSFAKNKFFAGLTQPGPVNIKVGSQVIFYGLPMYELDLVGPVLDDPTELVPTASTIDDVLARDVSYDGTQGSGLLERVDSTDQNGATESYWKVASQEGTEVQQGRPIQPRWTSEVTAGDGDGGLAAVARGAIVETLTTTEIGGINPVISTPVMAEGDEVAESDPTGIAFPDAFARVASLSTPTGQVQQLALVPGQFRSAVGETNGTQRLFDSAGLTVYYVDEDDPAVPQALKDDHMPPAIVGVQGTTANGLVTFDVAARDPETDTARVLVLMSDATSATRTWQPVELGHNGTRASDGATLFTTTVASPWSEVEFIVQAVDNAGNVAISTNRGDFHPAVAQVSNPDPGGGAPSLAIVSGTLHESGFYTSDVTVEVTPADPADVVLVRVDGQAATTEPGPFVVTGSGPHTVEAWTLGDEDNKATVSFGIDVDAPVISLNGGFEDGVIVPRDTILELPAVSVTDAGSGFADGSPSITGGSTSITGLHAFSVSATDRVGLSAAASRDYRVVDVVHEEAVHVEQTVTVDVLGVEAGAMVDFGDGFVTAANTPVTVNGEAGYRASHAYSAIGTYPITVTVDGVVIDGGLIQVFSTFDLKDKVSGTGTLIGSVLGILHGAPTPVLPTVAINVNYVNAEPTGTMTLNDTLAGFTFSSTQVTTIAVQNKVAQVQGVGTLPGISGNVRWHVTIVDGGFLGLDKLRIRVWKGTEVFYDTHPGALLTTPEGAPVLLGGYTLTSSD